MSKLLPPPPKVRACVFLLGSFLLGCPNDTGRHPRDAGNHAPVVDGGLVSMVDAQIAPFDDGDPGDADHASDGGAAPDGNLDATPADPADLDATTDILDAGADANTNTTPDASAAPTLVQLESGLVQGKVEGQTRLFLAIPYARPALGALRFAPPQPVEPWGTARMAVSDGPSCIQPVGAVQGPLSEDCLTLNVFAPLTPPSEGAAVMVFFHGGGFGVGGAAGYPSQWLSEPTGTLVVTVNYRLGALGFMTHPAIDEAIDVPSGNMGLRDQQLALAWVHDNIAAFGGDPARVTVFGESAGALSACLHMFMPDSAGLVQGFIMESGSCVAGSLAPITRAKALEGGTRFADKHCGGTSDKLTCLRGLPAEAFAVSNVVEAAVGANAGTWPHVDGALIPKPPLELLRAGRFARAPFIAGSNRREASLYEVYGLPHIHSQLDLLGILLWWYPDTWPEIYEHYAPVEASDSHEAYIRALTDEQFRCATRLLVREASAQEARAYLYSFDVAPAAHSQELDYVFGWPGGSVSKLFPDEAPLPPLSSVVNAVQRYWGSFAKTFDPNDGVHLAWPAYQRSSDAHMEFGEPLKVGTALSRDDCDFWDELYARDS